MTTLNVIEVMFFMIQLMTRKKFLTCKGGNMQQDDDQKLTVEDQELASMIADLNAQVSSGVPVPPAPPTPPAPSAVPATPELPGKEQNDFSMPTPPKSPAIKPPVSPIAPAPVVTSVPLPKIDGDLSSVKRDALNELRPLVDKLDLPAEEKFDTLLLLIRSTDDKSLVASAHEAARKIEDETRRANALLDIVKEIDFFEHPVN